MCQHFDIKMSTFVIKQQNPKRYSVGRHFKSQSYTVLRNVLYNLNDIHLHIIQLKDLTLTKKDNSASYLRQWWKIQQPVIVSFQ